ELVDGVPGDDGRGGPVLQAFELRAAGKSPGGQGAEPLGKAHEGSPLSRGLRLYGNNIGSGAQTGHPGKVETSTVIGTRASLRVRKDVGDVGPQFLPRGTFAFGQAGQTSRTADPSEVRVSQPVPHVLGEDGPELVGALFQQLATGPEVGLQPGQRLFEPG